MSRTTRRRLERARLKGRLDPHDARGLNEARRLPDDHPSASGEEPRYTDTGRGQRLLDLLRRCGVAEELQRRLGAHPGKASRLGVEALLLAVLLAAWEVRSYRRTDVCAVLNGLDAALANAVGLYDDEAGSPVSYSVICKQLKRVESALRDGWVGNDGARRDLAWFTRTLLGATIPAEVRDSVTAAALDSTFLATWAVSRRYSSDPLATHRLAARDTPDLPEPETSAPATSGDPAWVGDDGRLIPGADPDARYGYRSATSKTLARTAYGYDMHIAVAVRGAHWSGDPGRLALGEAVPAYICALAVAAGSTNPGPLGRGVIDETLAQVPNVAEIIADRAYTAKRTTFVRPLRADGLDVVMDHSVTEVARPKVITAGRRDQVLINHCGTLLPAWVPEGLHAPAENLTPTQRTDWYTQRARLRWLSQQHLPGGRVQLRCPQCAGRVATDAATRNPTKRPGAGVPYIGGTGRKYCCEGLVTLDADQIDNYQTVPYGTYAWQRSYGRRNQVENTNSRLRDKGALEPGACRGLGLIARTICALAVAVTYNLALMPTAVPASTSGPAEIPVLVSHTHGATADSEPLPSRAPP